MTLVVVCYSLGTGCNLRPLPIGRQSRSVDAGLTDGSYGLA